MATFAKILVLLLGTLLVVLLGVFGALLHATYRQYRTLAEREAEVAGEVEHLRVERDRKHEYLNLLGSDRDFVERVVREKLNYVAPDETLFQFEVPTER